MTTQTMDSSIEATSESMVITASGSVTGDVAISYDDTISDSELYVLLTRMRDKLNEIHD
jgi:hypothetical protein